MKRTLLLMICTILFFVPSICKAGLNDNPTIAILPFVNKAAMSEGLQFSDASIISEFMIEKLLESDRFYNVIERENMSAIVNEHTFNMNIMVDPLSAVQIGKILGAQYLVAGSVTGLSTKLSGVDLKAGNLANAGLQKYTVIANVSARFIEVETGRIVLAASGTGESATTNVEFELKRKLEGEEEVGVVVDDNEGIEDVVDNPTSSVESYKIRIGSQEFSQVQVRNALYKAVYDLVYNKNYGVITKLDGKAKIRKV